MDVEVAVSVLGPVPQEMTARLLDSSGSGILLRTPRALPCGSPVRIEGGDILLLGDVCRCEPGEEHFRIAVQVRHSLGGLTELARLNRILLGDVERDAAEPVPVRG